jgi:broad specificity phosphatase PhoE
MSAVIMLIRHAEKPLGDAPPHGVTADGVQDQESLTTRGWQRAGALVGLFGRPEDARSARPTLGTPTHLFASKVGVNSSSRRPLETLQPLADRLGLDIETRFLKHDQANLIEAIRAIDGVVLVSWEHALIPSMAAQVVGDAAQVPTMWPDDRYDLVWIFEPDATGRQFGFRQAPQMLLAGDRPDPIRQEANQVRQPEPDSAPRCSVRRRFSR